MRVIEKDFVEETQRGNSYLSKLNKWKHPEKTNPTLLGEYDIYFQLRGGCNFILPQSQNVGGILI